MDGRYQNYNKFISATDTIRRMKGSVQEMEAAMQSLVERVDAMTATSAKVADALAPRRYGRPFPLLPRHASLTTHNIVLSSQPNPSQRISKLVGVNRLLTKLEFLFELPVRLRRSIDLDAHAQAVK